MVRTLRRRGAPPSLRPVLALAASLVVALVAVALPPRALADCEPSSWAPLEVTPSVGAPNVTTDAFVQVHFTPGYFGPLGPGGEPTGMIHLNYCGACGMSCVPGTTTPVAGHAEVLGDELFFVPDLPLVAGGQYEGRVTGRDGSIAFRFCASRWSDSGPPRFDGVVRVTSEPVEPSCDLPDGGYRAGVFVRPATDDGPGGSIEYLLFLTRAEGLTAPVLVDRVRNFASDEITLRAFITEDQASSFVCVRAAVVDGVGHVAMDPEEHCFDPIAKLAFQGCSVSAPGGRGAPLTLLALSAALVLALVLRRRRAR